MKTCVPKLCTGQQPVAQKVVRPELPQPQLLQRKIPLVSKSQQASVYNFSDAHWPSMLVSTLRIFQGSFCYGFLISFHCVCMVSILSDLLRLVLWHSKGSTLENVLCD